MKRKLTTKDIAGYFPYGLYVVTEDKSAPMFHVMELQRPALMTLEPCEENGATIFSDDDYGIIDLTIEDVSNVCPILRPLSDLYKQIIHNSESFIPIVRLAEITFPDEAPWTVGKGETSCVAKSGELFHYDDGFYSYESDGRDLYVCPQTPLFDLLNEWKIDYRGLINAGLAVDVNGLKINPYA